MQQPVDYPLEDEEAANLSLCDKLSFAALLDRHDAQLMITEEMIQSACLQMELAQQFPVAKTAQAISVQVSANRTSKPQTQAYREIGLTLSRWTKLTS